MNSPGRNSHALNNVNGDMKFLSSHDGAAAGGGETTQRKNENNNAAPHLGSEPLRSSGVGVPGASPSKKLGEMRLNLNNGGASDDILNNSLLSSTMKNHEVTLNRNQSSSLPNIER